MAEGSLEVFEAGLDRPFATAPGALRRTLGVLRMGLGLLAGVGFAFYLVYLNVRPDASDS